jgi:hypothetical protein
MVARPTITANAIAFVRIEDTPLSDGSSLRLIAHYHLSCGKKRRVRAAVGECTFAEAAMQHLARSGVCAMSETDGSKKGAAA